MKEKGKNVLPGWAAAIYDDYLLIDIALAANTRIKSTKIDFYIMPFGNFAAFSDFGPHCKPTYNPLRHNSDIFPSKFGLNNRRDNPSE